MAVGCLSGQRLKHRATFYIVSWHVSAVKAQRSSGNKFSPLLFFLFSISKGVLVL
jgi:hypothetical protein